MAALFSGYCSNYSNYPEFIERGVFTNVRKFILTEHELNQLEKEVKDLKRANKMLTKELKQMTAEVKRLKASAI